ncbi:hypothetical protein JNUCC1_02733 [Lentibacillus sp. JNUCC-1]|uniref:hypothetical protein n=1 Tax=Lentibacillus sp. JNUCC-1 TaxID=2654513 RepID=UPI0012E715DA|nr:hypothetical protein [Lentibacillus sp. JNUCC-1]MUV38862.1 hypothetical protein [Lentibacillus sp. JNUCC-1]
MSKPSTSSLVIGALSGAVLGFGIRTVVSKKDKISAKVKELDRRLYEDGKVQANKISRIKQDVNEQVKQ